MLDYSLEHLRAFYFTAKLKSFTKASEALYRTQPAISNSIICLEKALGVKLFERSPGGTTLSPEGALMYAHVSAAFDRLLLGERELEEAKRSIKGALKISCTETPLYHFILPRVKAFREKFPEISLSITGGASVNEATALLRSGQSDIAMGVTPLSGAAGLVMKNCGAFEDTAVASFRFRELGRKTVTAEQLAAYPLIAAQRDSGARKNLDEWFASQGIIFEPAFTVHTSSAILTFAREGLGIGFLPSFFAKRYLRPGELFRIRLNSPLPRRNMVMLYREDAPLSYPAKAFLEFLTKK